MVLGNAMIKQTRHQLERAWASARQGFADACRPRGHGPRVRSMPRTMKPSLSAMSVPRQGHHSTRNCPRTWATSRTALWYCSCPHLPLTVNNNRCSVTCSALWGADNMRHTFYLVSLRQWQKEHSMATTTNNKADPIALGPDSLAWKHAGDNLQLLMAGTTLLLQVSHPVVGAGVGDPKP